MTVAYPDEYSLFPVSTLTRDTPLPDRIYGKHGTMEVGGEPLQRANGRWARRSTRRWKGW